MHYAKNDWNISFYPLVPGHEIVGRIKEVGSLVDSHKKNDLVGVGVMVDSCQKCSSCIEILNNIATLVQHLHTMLLIKYLEK